MLDLNSFQFLALNIDFEKVLPVILLIGYAIVQFIGARKNEGREEEAEDPAMDERARKIREEIQRKIEERRRSVAGKVAPAQQERVERETYYDPTLPDRQQQPSPVYRTAPERFEPVQERSREIRREAESLRQSGESRMEYELSEQRKRLEESRLQRDAALKKAEKIRGRSAYTMDQRAEFSYGTKRSPGSSKSTRGSFRDELVDSLHDKNSLKKAVLLTEILGKPKGLQ